MQQRDLSQVRILADAVLIITAPRGESFYYSRGFQCLLIQKQGPAKGVVQPRLISDVFLYKSNDKQPSFRRLHIF